MQRNILFTLMAVLFVASIVFASSGSSWTETYNLTIESYYHTDAHPNDYWSCDGYASYRLLQSNFQYESWYYFTNEDYIWNFSRTGWGQQLPGQDPTYQYMGWQSYVDPTDTAADANNDNPMYTSLGQDTHTHTFEAENRGE